MAMGNKKGGCGSWIGENYALTTFVSIEMVPPGDVYELQECERADS